MTEPDGGGLVIPKKGESLEVPERGTRNVLAGRKKLKEFYQLKKQEKEAAAAAASATATAAASTENSNGDANDIITFENSLSLLDDEEKLKKYLQTNSIDDILKLRNSIAHKLSSHDSAKKSIVYDNYYELIKLSETLGSLSNGEHTVDLSPTIHGVVPLSRKGRQVIDSGYLESVFDDLTSFVDNRVTNFCSNFQEIATAPSSNDDNSSITGMIARDEDDNNLSANKSKLEAELNILLKSDFNQFTEKQKSDLIKELKDIKSLSTTNYLLSNQIDQIIAKVSI